MSDVAVVARNTGNLQHIQTSSCAKDPFYKKETREVFRRLFGKPGESSSHLKIYFVLPVYIKFGGSICNCLKLWLDAPAWDPSNDAYYIVPKHIDEEKKRKTQDPILLDFLEETNFGQKDGPMKCQEWTLGDPRFNDDKNPLFNPKASKDKNWHENLTYKAYKEFRIYAQEKYIKIEKEVKPKEENLKLDKESATYLDGPGDFRVKVTKIVDENGVPKKEGDKESVVMEILPKDPILAEKMSGRTHEYLKHLPEFGGPPLPPKTDPNKPHHIYVPDPDEDEPPGFKPSPYAHLNLTESQRRHLPAPYHLSDSERRRLEAKRVEQEREVAILRELVERQERHSATFEKDLDEDGKTKGGTLHFDFVAGPESGPSKQKFTQEVSQIMKENLCDVPNIPNSVWNKVEQSQSKERTKERLRKKLAQKKGCSNQHVFSPALSEPGRKHCDHSHVVALDQPTYTYEGMKEIDELIAANDKTISMVKPRHKTTQIESMKTPVVVEAKDILTDKKKRQNVMIITSLDSDEEDIHELSVRNRIKQALIENYHLEHGSEEEKNLVLEHGDKEKRLESVIKQAHRLHMKREGKILIEPKNSHSEDEDYQLPEDALQYTDDGLPNYGKLIKDTLDEMKEENKRGWPLDRAEDFVTRPKRNLEKADIYEPLTIEEIDDDEDEISEDIGDIMKSTARNPEESGTARKASESDSDKKTRRVCSSCDKTEDKQKMFKKCSRCKKQNTVPARYYCSKECQVADWMKRHKVEHKISSLSN